METTVATPAAATTQAAGATTASAAVGSPAGQVTTATPAEVIAPAAAAPLDWTQSLSDDYKGYAQNKGFKDANAVLESYVNLEKLLGAPKERLLKLPEKEDDPAWNDIYTKLGKPATAKEYDIKVPEGMGDAKFADWARNTFHELGMPKKMADTLANKWNEHIVGNVNAQKEAYAEAIKQQEVSLKREWGAAFEQNKNMASKAVRELGLSDQVIDKLEAAMGFADTVKFLHGLGSKIGEAPYVSGDQGGSRSGFGVMSPVQAQSRIKELGKDADFVKRYSNGDATAKAEMNKLHAWAYPEA